MTEQDELSWLHELHDARDEIRHVAAGLYSLAICLNRVGNVPLADMLEEYATHLKKQEERLDRVAEVKTRQYLRQAQESTATMLDAIMAGVIIAKDSE